MQLLSLPSLRPPPVLTSSPPLPCEGGAEESSSTRYCGWYNGLCIWSCYCLGCREVIQWHFNRLSAFFAMALVLICRIKTQPVRHWTCCLGVEQRGSVLTARTAAHTSPRTARDELISDKPRFPAWRPLMRGWFVNMHDCLRESLWETTDFQSCPQTPTLCFLCSDIKSYFPLLFLKFWFVCCCFFW